MSVRKFRQMINIPAELSDGTKLSCDVRLPIGDGPFPAILLRTPYNKTRSSTDSEMLSWISAGYAYVTQDCRGCHESQGQYDPFRQEAADGSEAVDWVASQDWCDGRVAMAGGSYCGWTQLSAASKSPAALKAITPVVMGIDGYHDLAFNGGAISLFLLWWLIQNDGRSQRDTIGIDWDDHYNCLPVTDMDSDVGCLSPVMQTWLAHPRRDEYWQAADLSEGFSQTNAAVLLTGGWYDPFINGTIKAFQCIKQSGEKANSPEVRMIIGPWGHGVNTTTKMGDLDFGEHSRIELEAEKKAFIAAHIEGGENIRTAAPVKVFVTGSNRWCELENWPPEQSKTKQLLLGCSKFANSMFGDGVLSDATLPNGRDSDGYDYDPMNPVPAIGGASLMIVREDGPMDQRPAERRDDVLCYTGEKLTQSLEIMGNIAARLFVASSAVDTDFIARLCDLHPDGKSVYVCDGILRMRFREGFDSEVFMTPGEVYEISIDMGNAAHCFEPGHSIRLEVTSSCMPRFERNLNTGGENATESVAITASQKIFHDAKRPSALILPVTDM